MGPSSLPISVSQKSWGGVGGQFESHRVTQRIRMLVLARAAGGLGKHFACFTGRGSRYQGSPSDLLKAPNHDGKSLLVMPSSILLQGNSSLNSSSSAAVGRRSSVHFCLLSVKGETGWRMGQGNYALKKSFFPPWVCKHSNNGRGWSLSLSKGSWVNPVGNCGMIKEFKEESLVLRGL